MVIVFRQEFRPSYDKGDTEEPVYGTYVALTGRGLALLTDPRTQTGWEGG